MFDFCLPNTPDLYSKIKYFHFLVEGKLYVLLWSTAKNIDQNGIMQFINNLKPITKPFRCYFTNYKLTTCQS